MHLIVKRRPTCISARRPRPSPGLRTRKWTPGGEPDRPLGTTRVHSSEPSGLQWAIRARDGSGPGPAGATDRGERGADEPGPRFGSAAELAANAGIPQGVTMKHAICLGLPLAAAQLSVAQAEILPTFHVASCSYRASDIVLVQLEPGGGGSFRVVDSWKGDSKRDEILEIPRLAGIAKGTMVRMALS